MEEVSEVQRKLGYVLGGTYVLLYAIGVPLMISRSSKEPIKSRQWPLPFLQVLSFSPFPFLSYVPVSC